MKGFSCTEFVSIVMELELCRITPEIEEDARERKTKWKRAEWIASRRLQVETESRRCR